MKFGPCHNIKFLVGYRSPKSIVGTADGAFIAAQERAGDMFVTMTLYDGARIVGSCYKYDFDEQVKSLVDQGWIEMGESDVYSCMGDSKIPFWKDRNDPLARALKQVELDSSTQKNHGGISGDGLFYYLESAPTVVYDIKEHKLETARDHIILTYNIERKGDVLLNILVKSEQNINIKEISLYQYDWTGSSKVVFYHSLDSKSEYVISPFIDGIPLQQIGKAIHLSIIVSGGGTHVGGIGEYVNVSGTYAFLDDITRKNVASYQDGEGHGIRIRHTDGTIYRVHNVNDYGHSPNYLGPLST
jgi:hypothetical protein